jgi:hypothetical protein
MKKFFLVSSLLSIFAVPIFVFAQTNISISSSVPGMGTVTSSTPPGAYISGFYNFALMIGGVLAFGAIVYGGVLYAASMGNPSRQSEGKEWIKSALLGLLLLAGAYLVLYTINPELVDLSLPTLAPINIQTPSEGNQSGGSVTCTPASSGPCSVTQLKSTCLGSSANSASEICNAESSGNAVAGGDISTNGQPVSIGLFQINLSANTIAGLNCPSAFNHSWHVGSPSTITNPTLYAQCVAAAKNVATNIAKACSLSNNGANWSKWSTARTCGL